MTHIRVFSRRRKSTPMLFYDFRDIWVEENIKICLGNRNRSRLYPLPFGVKVPTNIDNSGVIHTISNIICVNNIIYGYVKP